MHPGEIATCQNVNVYILFITSASAGGKALYCATGLRENGDGVIPQIRGKDPLRAHSLRRSWLYFAAMAGDALEDQGE
ncbi:MAG: hypothetical protein ABGX47_08560 [Martelella sp.]|uniref:hypothetical protein n=1 Tax=Martelella sp. TaxID=1969699 RepID=UPI003242F02E